MTRDRFTIRRGYIQPLFSSPGPDLISFLSCDRGAVFSSRPRRVPDALERLTKNRTTIIIAHRMSTVVKAERVVVLDQGRTVQQGSYRELRRAADTSYDRLCRSAVDVDEGRETPYLSLLAQEGVKK